MTLHHPGGPDIIIKVLVNERLEVRGERRCYAAGFADGRKGPQAKE